MSALTIEQPLVLIVEGDDDKNFFEVLGRHLGLRNVQVLQADGKHNLRHRVAAITNTSGFFSTVRALGVVRDADSDPRAAFQSVHDALAAAGLPAPGAPLEVAEGPIPVSVMILPGGDRTGKIEDLCLASVVADPAFPCIDAYFECLQTTGVPQSGDLSKAKVQAFLASRPRPCPHLGVAALQGHWPWDDGAFDDAKRFLRQLAARVHR